MSDTAKQYEEKKEQKEGEMRKMQYRHEECIDRYGRENELTQHIEL